MRLKPAKVRGGDALRRSLSDKDRKRRADLSALRESGVSRSRNDLLPKLQLVHRNPNDLVVPTRQVRKLHQGHLRRVMQAINVAGFVDPVFIDQDNRVWDGVTRVEAGKILKLTSIPCILAFHLTVDERKTVRLALNRLGEKGAWDLAELKAELMELTEAGFEIEDTGFTIAEFDQITISEDVEPIEEGTLSPQPKATATSKIGDVFVFPGGHRVAVGDAADPAIYSILMQGEQARFIHTDEPYNVPISGHVTKGEHREFVMATGEMSDDQFRAFNDAWMAAALPHLRDGGLLGSYIDWRGYPIVHAAASQAGLAALNLIVWAKTNAGMGSLYRSQHELFSLFKKGKATHVNNIELGKNGRWRSNVWTYPGASSLGSDSRSGLEFHPTVKPAAMCADAILDLTNRGDVVLDPFLGSGSTLIAAERIGRRCFGIELDPLYVDVVINRYQQVSGLSALLESTGETFDQLARHRKNEAAKA